MSLNKLIKRRDFIAKLAIYSTIPIVLTACYGPPVSDETMPDENQVYPEVFAIYVYDPILGQSVPNKYVHVESMFNICFSKDMTVGAVNSIVFIDSADVNIPFSYNWSNPKTIVLEPKDNLDYASTYKIYVTNAATDTNGNYLIENINSSFEFETVYIELEFRIIELIKGESTVLNVLQIYKSIGTIALDEDWELVSWQSTDISIAEAENDGTINAIKEGTTLVNGVFKIEGVNHEISVQVNVKV